MTMASRIFFLALISPFFVTCFGEKRIEERIKEEEAYGNMNHVINPYTPITRRDQKSCGA